MSDTEGFIQNISVPTFIQLLEQERRTCSIRVASGDDSAVLHFVDGDLIDAEAGELNGMAAAYEVVGWPDADIEILRYRNHRERRIDQPLRAILLDGSRLNDERRRSQEDADAAARVAEALTSIEEGDRPYMSNLQQVLDAFREEVPEFVSTDIVNIDSGLSIGGGSADPDFDASVASASYAEVVKANSRALDLLEIGAESTEDILITTERVYVLIRRMGDEYYHVLAVGRKGNLGLARAIMKKYEPKLLESIGDLA